MSSEYNIRVRIKPDGSGGKEVESQLDRLEKRARDFESTLKRALGALAVGAGIHKLGELADAYDRAYNSVRSQTKSEAEALVVREQLFLAADRSNAKVDETVHRYHELSEATHELGLSQRELITAVETLNKLEFAEGGAGKATAVINQLKLAMQQGAIESRQLRVIIKEMPELASALAKALGVESVTSLKKLANEGKITTDVIRKALGGLSELVDGKFSNSVDTLSGAWNRLNNELQRVSGEFGRSSGITQAFIAVLDFLKENLEVILRILTAAAVALTVAFAGPIIAFAIATIGSLGVAVGLLAAGIGIVVAFGDRIPLVSQVLSALGNVAKAVFGYMKDVVNAIGEFLSSLSFGTIQVAALDILINAVTRMAKAFVDLGIAMQRVWGLGAAGRGLMGAATNLYQLKDSLIASRNEIALEEELNKRRAEAKRARGGVDLDKPGTNTAGDNAFQQKYADVLDKINRELKKEGDLLHLNNEEREIRKQLFQYEERFEAIHQKISPRDRDAIEQRIRDLQQLKKVMTVIEDAAKTVFKGMEDAIISFVQTGKFEFKKFADSVIADLIRIALQAFVTKPLVNAVTGAFGSAFSGGSGVDPFGGGLPGFATGGSFTVGGSGGTDSQLVAFRATPGERVDVSHGQGKGGVQVNNYVTSSKDMSVRSEQRQVGGRTIIETFIEEVKKEMASGGFDGTMGARYGARQVVRRR